MLFGMAEVGVCEAKGKLTMRSLLILVAICFSASAFAQSAPPKIGNKRLVQVKPKEPMGCKLIGTVRRTKLWDGDCVGSELKGSTTTTETQASPEQEQPRPIRKSDDHPRPITKGDNSLRLSSV